MRKILSLSLIISLLFPYISILRLSNVSALEVNESSEMLLTQRRRGGRSGSRSGGRSRTPSRGSRNINRRGLGSSGSRRINRTRPSNRPNRSGSGRPGRPTNLPSNRPNRPSTGRPGRPVNLPSNRPWTLPSNRQGIGRLRRPNQPIIRDRRRINIDSRRRNTNRINRNIINNGNIVVNPRRNYGSWGWRGGSPWYPNYGYWGGGFWGGFAVGAFTTAVTGAIINSSSSGSQTNYVVIEKNTPGYYLFDSYGLTQVQCTTSQDLVFIYGPQDTLMCAIPNSNVVAGYYDVDPEDLVLILRD